MRGDLLTRYDADLEGENVFGDLFAFQNLFGLQFKLIHGRLPRSTGSLVRADYHTLHLQRNSKYNRSNGEDGNNHKHTMVTR